MRSAVAAALLAALAAPAFAAEPDKPNVVYVLADDFGYGDAGCYNPKSKIPTPQHRPPRQRGDAVHRRALRVGGLLADALRHPHRPLRLAHQAPPRRPRPVRPAAHRRRPAHRARPCSSRTATTPPASASGTSAGTGRRPTARWCSTKPITERADGARVRLVLRHRRAQLPAVLLHRERPHGRTADRREDRARPQRPPGADAAGVEVRRHPARRSRRRRPATSRDRAKDGKPFFLYFPLTSPHEPIAPSAKFKGKSGISDLADFFMETDWAVGEVLAALDAAQARGEHAGDLHLRQRAREVHRAAGAGEGRALGRAARCAGTRRTSTRAGTACRSSSAGRAR